MRKLKMTFISLLFVTLTFFTSVYAWLHISNITMIDDIYLNVRMGDDLEISLDGVNYSKSIDYDVVKDQIKNLSFVDVTSFDSKKFTLGPMLNYREATKNKHYLSLDLWFKVTPEKGIEDSRVFKEIYLVNNLHISYDDAKNKNIEGTYITSKGVGWKSDYSFNNGSSLVNKGDYNTYYAKDAMRIGVSSKDNTFIYDTSEDSKRSYGTTFGAFDYYNIKNDIKAEIPKEKPNTIYKLSEEYGHTGIMNSDDSLITTLEKTSDGSYRGRATISIWLEGWDADAFDAIKKDHLLIQLQFQAARRLESDEEEIK